MNLHQKTVKCKELESYEMLIGSFLMYKDKIKLNIYNFLIKIFFGNTVEHSIKRNELENIKAYRLLN